MRDEDRPTGLVRAILDLLADLDERGERTGRGRWSSGRADVDYSVEIGGLDDFSEASRLDEPGASAITTRTFDDEVLVVADLPNVRSEDVSARVAPDDGAVTIGIDGYVVERVPLDEEGWSVADVTVNNDVVEVRLTRD